MNRLLLAVFAACLAFGALPSSLYGVDDTTPPTLTVPGDITTPATSAAGATVTFTATATDDVDPSPVVACNPSSGSTFVIGTTAVNCTATDAANNQSQGSFNVTVSPFAAPPGDTTDPTLSLPSDITAPATTSAGATGSFTVTATDDTDPNPVVVCNPSSGSTFVIGTTPVGCTATDASNNQAHGGFNVTVTPLAPAPDTAGPVFSGVPGTITVQANGPGGSVVNYVQPTASDEVDGPAIVTCTPTSGSLFPLGTTTVSCSASDNHGNSNGASFAVVVADKTPPTLIVPIDSAAYAESPTGLSAGGYGLRQFLAAAHASDLVDPRPRISNDAGEFLTVGVHTITFSAVDASGNAVSAAAGFQGRPPPPSRTPPLPLPPERKAPPHGTGLQATS